MDRKLYETLVTITELAVDGVEAIKRDATCPEDRLREAEGQAAIVMAQYYVNEYAEQYRNGDLK